MTMQNPWAGFLEEEPKTAYFSFSNEFGGPQKSQRQQNFFRDQFSNIYNQYLGNLGRQVRAGQVPTEQFQDFMGGFDFADWYRQQTSFQQRNPNQSSFAPNTQWQLPWAR